MQSFDIQLLGRILGKHLFMLQEYNFDYDMECYETYSRYPRGTFTTDMTGYTEPRKESPRIYDIGMCYSVSASMGLLSIEESIANVVLTPCSSS